MRSRRCDAALTRPHDCELVISELITNVDRYASGPMWASVDWCATEPTIRVAHVGPGFDLQIQLPGVDSVGGRGLFIVDTLVTGLESFRRFAGGSTARWPQLTSRRTRVPSEVRAKIRRQKAEAGRMVTRHIGTVGRLVVALGVVFAVIGSQSAAAQQAPVGLGTARSFAVLAGTTVTNTGPSTISGDLGVSPGSAVVGFPPGTVSNGVIHAADAVALQAQADVTTAYNDAAGRATTATVTADLGGQTLVAGVYTGGALGLTGALTLDAQGDPNAVFVFQAASTLITASTSSVNLINGANPCNVYWQVGSSATLKTNSVFVGTVLALTSVAANTGATVQGRLLARNGEVTLDNNVITVPNCASAPPATTTTTAVPTTTTASGATTTVAPTPNLPETGATTGTAIAGLFAVGIGSALVLLAARRTTTATHRR